MICRICQAHGWPDAKLDFLDEDLFNAHITEAHGTFAKREAPLIHVRAKECPPSGAHPTLCGLFSYHRSFSFAYFQAAMGPRTGSEFDTFLADLLANALSLLPHPVCGDCAATFAEEE